MTASGAPRSSALTVSNAGDVGIDMRASYQQFALLKRNRNARGILVAAAVHYWQAWTDLRAKCS